MVTSIKRLTISVILLFTYSSILLSQPYIKFGGGYSIDFGGMILDRQSTYTSKEYSNYTDYTEQIEAVYSSFGEGFFLSSTFGMKLNPYLGGEVSIEYDFGSEYESKNNSYHYYINSSNNYLYESTNKWSFSMLVINPSIIVGTDTKQIDPYMKVGFILSIPKLSYKYLSSYSSYKEKYSGGIGLGFSGSLGAKMFTNENIAIWSEINYKYISWKPTGLEATDSKGITKTYELKDSYTDNYRYVNSVRVPEQSIQVAPKFPFSSLGFSVGLQISFDN